MLRRRGMAGVLVFYLVGKVKEDFSEEVMIRLIT